MNTLLKLSTGEFLSSDFTVLHEYLVIHERGIDAWGRTYVIEHEGLPFEIAHIQSERKYYPFTRMTRKELIEADLEHIKGIQRIELEIATQAPFHHRFNTEYDKKVWRGEQFVLTPDGLRKLQQRIIAMNEETKKLREIKMYDPSNESQGSVIFFPTLKRRTRHFKIVGQTA